MTAWVMLGCVVLFCFPMASLRTRQGRTLDAIGWLLLAFALCLGVVALGVGWI